MRIHRGQSGTRPGNFWVGCLVVLALAIIALVIGGWFVMNNWRGWVAGPMQDVMNQAVAQAELPEEQRLAIETEIGGLMDRFRAGDLTMEEFGLIVEGVVEGPVLPAAIVLGFDKTYYAKNEALTDEQKAEARKQMSRFITGVTTEQIPQTKIDDAIAPISDPNGAVKVQAGNVNISIKDPKNTTPEELMQVIANMQAEADTAGIEDKEFTVNIADEFTRVIDDALGRESSLPPAPTPAAVPALPEGDGGEG